MAEGYLRKLITERGIGDVVVKSAGIGALAGYPAAEAACEVARRNSFSIEDHRATQVTTAALQKADFVLVMEKYQEEAAKYHAGKEAGKVRLLGSYRAQGKPEIDDPYGTDVEYYESIFAVIKEAVEGFLEKEISKS